MLISLTLLLATLSSLFHSRAAIELENLAMRHQIGVLQRSAAKRPRLTSGDRLLWIWLSRLWRSALAIVKPETVIAWHRAGQPGRSVISREVRDLIRKMCQENPRWGAPRIHGELLKLGIDVGESSVSKYMVRCRKPLRYQSVVIGAKLVENHFLRSSPRAAITAIHRPQIFPSPFVSQPALLEPRFGWVTS